MKRHFAVKFENHISIFTNTSCGLPKSWGLKIDQYGKKANLGSLLFLIFVNNVTQVENLDVNLYVEDSRLFFQNKDIP